MSLLQVQKELEELDETYRELQALIIKEPDDNLKQEYVVQLRKTQKRVDYLRKEAEKLKKSKGDLNDRLTELQKQKDEVVSLKNTFKKTSDELAAKRDQHRSNHSTHASIEEMRFNRGALLEAYDQQEYLREYNAHKERQQSSSNRDALNFMAAQRGQQPWSGAYPQTFSRGQSSAQHMNPGSLNMSAPLQPPPSQSSVGATGGSGFQSVASDPRYVQPYVPAHIAPYPPHQAASYPPPQARLPPQAYSLPPPPTRVMQHPTYQAPQTGFQPGHGVNLGTFGGRTEMEEAGIFSHRRTQSNVSQKSSVYTQHTDSSHRSSSSGHSGHNNATNAYQNYGATSRTDGSHPYSHHPPSY